jgi:dTDP-4-dehydrorhamnose 3,5-epimerase
MNRFEKILTPIDGLLVLKTSKIEDSRGHLSRFFCADELKSFGWLSPIVQVNFTSTLRKGTVRGFHYQHPPEAELKYIRCLRGSIYDVALDLRQNSDTFLHSYAQILSEDNNTSFLLPPGVAHGYQSLTNNVELLYFHSEQYNPNCEDGVNPLDPRIKVKWPEEISNVSKNDIERPYISNTFKGVNIELSSL